MLPETADGKGLFFSYRDHRSRWRKWTLDFHNGDQGLLKSRAFQSLALEADLASMKEQIDFMQSEGHLTQAQLEAAENCFAWGSALLQLIPEDDR